MQPYVLTLVGCVGLASLAVFAQAVAGQDKAKDVAVQLEGFDAAKKANLIKAVSEIIGQSSTDPKELVESVGRSPRVVKDQLTQDEADKIQKQLEGVGGKVALKKVITSQSGLKFIDMKDGNGEKAKAGDQVEVHYTGWLTNGKKFDSSLDSNEPFEFPLGARKVIKGWDEGVAGMKPGGKRRLIIPAELGYGARGAGDVIPPNAVLVFEVELLKIKSK